MENKPNYFAIIPANVRYDKELVPNAKLLYGEISALCNEKGYCYANNYYFADLYDATERSVSDWITQLKDKGYIKVEMMKIEDDSIKRIIYLAEEKTKENESSLAEDFEKIWLLYPRKDNKNTAFKHYKSWLKGKKYAGKTVKLTNKEMWFATKKYADQVKENNTEKQYIKMGSTFFNESIYEYVEKTNENGGN